jgi:hypothetical protein
MPARSHHRVRWSACPQLPDAEGAHVLPGHPIQLSWALSDQPVFPQRGPLSTAGIESTRQAATGTGCRRSGSKSGTMAGGSPSVIRRSSRESGRRHVRAAAGRWRGAGESLARPRRSRDPVRVADGAAAQPEPARSDRVSRAAHRTFTVPAARSPRRQRPLPVPRRRHPPPISREAYRRR